MKRLTLYLLIFTINISFSQKIDITSEMSILNMSKRLDNESNIEGSPYITKDFVAAKVSLTENKILSVRYNAFSDEIEMKSEGEVIYNIDKNLNNLIVTILQSGINYGVYKYTSDNKTNIGYFIHINELSNTVKLLKKQRIILVDKKEAKSSYQTSSPAHFKRLEDLYYIKINDKNVVELPTNKKDIAKLFPKHEKEILNFIKKEKIKVKREDDAKSLINFINQLS